MAWIRFLQELRDAAGRVLGGRRAIKFGSGFALTDDEANDQVIVSGSGAPRVVDPVSGTYVYDFSAEETTAANYLFYVSISSGNNCDFSLTSSNLVPAGATARVFVRQGSSAGTLTWDPNAWKFGGNTAQKPATNAAFALDLYTFVHDGSFFRFASVVRNIG